MSSLAATTIRRPRTTEKTATDPVLAALSRLCALLDIDSVTLSRIETDGFRLLAASGASPDTRLLGPWMKRAAASDGPLIVADIARSQGSPAALGFYAGMVLPTGDDKIKLLLSLSDARPRSEAMAHRLAGLAIEVTSDATINRLARQIAQHKAQLALEQNQFERASQTAKIGIWSCDLADETLNWTDSVYDLFELPRGSELSRDVTLRHYTDQSRQTMEAARAQAIANCSDFTVDAEIITASGARRWMRLTGNVEARNGVAVRIFGMKQDITEEKLLADKTRYLAETDVMTGLANRSQFQTRLGNLAVAPIGGLLLVDLDGFKQINDSFGHALGDQCLREAARRLTACCDQASLLARIGGDEFAVLMGPKQTESEISALGDRIVKAVGQPYEHNGHAIALSASVGVACHRRGTADDLFHDADTALYAAKAAGRNTSRTHKH
ncbi:sensor domain-containing diguanylate cyclase [Devosia neptuniae]|uniref:sensor domain-containing diguanylate cyclase n=2 Tax=Devosia TaxID=46913 RepID=UPI0022AF5BBB|nr:sensor domain-containing diguanylate cyclase [Devosia neptuniae]MCZ4346333.1 sensor domain-containing diguanylate cyclase [Devosia neptuniae]